MAKLPLFPKDHVWPVFTPNKKENEAISLVSQDWIKMQNVLDYQYNQFNGRTLNEALDDWTKRWNGWVPPANPLLDPEQSRIFLNITRNIIIGYLSKVAMQPPKVVAKAYNKKYPIEAKKMSMIAQDMCDYSNMVTDKAEQEFFMTAFAATVKGTALTYEGYAHYTQEVDVAEYFDPETGEVITESKDQTLYDDCYQEDVPVEDFGILNAFQPDIQLQPAVAWRKLTSFWEAQTDLGHYPNWKYVKPGSYNIAPNTDGQTFYRQGYDSQLQSDQVEIIRYFRKDRNMMIIMANGIPLYVGRNPFKHGKYPFTKAIFEPFDEFFFWGAGFPNKIMGEQDLINTLYNMMVDKTEGSLLPYGLSSDLDDLIEDDILLPNKIRKVTNIDNWKFDSLPGVSGGETAMLQQTLNFIKENAGTYGGANAFTPRGGKLQTRQVMLQQQEAMQKVGFSSNFLEDYFQDRMEQRLANMMQFYSIPRLEKITGVSGRETEQLIYKVISLDDRELSEEYNNDNGMMQNGGRVIKLTEGVSPEDEERMSIENFEIEEKAKEMGTNLEVLSIDIAIFENFRYVLKTVKNSSYEKNQVIDQAKRQDYANWRIGLSKALPANMEELVGWVNEAYDLMPDEFNADMPQQTLPVGPDGQPLPQPGQGGAQESMFGPAMQAETTEQLGAGLE